MSSYKRLPCILSTSIYFLISWTIFIIFNSASDFPCIKRTCTVIWSLSNCCFGICQKPSLFWVNAEFFSTVWCKKWIYSWTNSEISYRNDITDGKCCKTRKVLTINATMKAVMISARRRVWMVIQNSNCSRNYNRFLVIQFHYPLEIVVIYEILNSNVRCRTMPLRDVAEKTAKHLSEWSLKQES